MGFMIISHNHRTIGKKHFTLIRVSPSSKIENVLLFFIIEPYFFLQPLKHAKKDEESNLPIAKIFIDRKALNTPFKLEPNLIMEGHPNPFEITRTFYKAIRENNPENSTSQGFPLSILPII